MKISRSIKSGAVLALFIAIGGIPGGWNGPSITAAATTQVGQTARRFGKPGLDDKIRVAFVLTEGAVMIDFAGPWETFQDVTLVPPGKTAKDGKEPFELYTVSGSKVRFIPPVE